MAARLRRTSSSDTSAHRTKTTERTPPATIWSRCVGTTSKPVRRSDRGRDVVLGAAEDDRRTCTEGPARTIRRLHPPCQSRCTRRLGRSRCRPQSRVMAAVDLSAIDAGESAPAVPICRPGRRQGRADKAAAEGRCRQGRRGTRPLPTRQLPQAAADKAAADKAPPTRPRGQDRRQGLSKAADKVATANTDETRSRPPTRR